MGSHNELVTGATKLFNVDISHTGKVDNAPFNVSYKNVFFVCASRRSNDAWDKRPFNCACMTRAEMDALVGPFWNQMPLFRAVRLRVWIVSITSSSFDLAGCTLGEQNR